MNSRQARDLDNYITGHYGEDQFSREESPMSHDPKKLFEEFMNRTGGKVTSLAIFEAGFQHGVLDTLEAIKHFMDKQEVSAIYGKQSEPLDDR